MALLSIKSYLRTFISSSRSSMSVTVSPLRKVYGSCISTARSSSSALMYFARRSIGFARPSRILILDLDKHTKLWDSADQFQEIVAGTCNLNLLSVSTNRSLAWCRWKLSSCSAQVLKCSASFSLCSISSSVSLMAFSRSRSKRSCFTYKNTASVIECDAFGFPQWFYVPTKIYYIRTALPKLKCDMVCSSWFCLYSILVVSLYQASSFKDIFDMLNLLCNKGPQD